MNLAQLSGQYSRNASITFCTAARKPVFAAEISFRRLPSRMWIRSTLTFVFLRRAERALKSAMVVFHKHYYGPKGWEVPKYLWSISLSQSEKMKARQSPPFLHFLLISRPLFV
jgi:hypothetical protein